MSRRINSGHIRPNARPTSCVCTAGGSTNRVPPDCTGTIEPTFVIGRSTLPACSVLQVAVDLLQLQRPADLLLIDLQLLQRLLQRLVLLQRLERRLRPLLLLGQLLLLRLQRRLQRLRRLQLLLLLLSQLLLLQLRRRLGRLLQLLLQLLGLLLGQLLLLRRLNDLQPQQIQVSIDLFRY